MGHVRGEERWAQVVALVYKEVYGDTTKSPYVLIQFVDDATTQYLPAEPRYWVQNGRIWEYRS